MTFLFFPDNTVMINFTLMERIDVFERLIGTRGAWTLTIEGECKRSAQEPGLQDLSKFETILGAALIPSPAERVDASVLRARLAAPNDSPLRHLGEAETIAVIRSRQLSAVFVTDDAGARALARTLSDVQTTTTGGLLRVAVRRAILNDETAWALIGLARSKGRSLPDIPRSWSAYREWLISP